MKVKCSECGTEMINQSRGPYIHFVCPKCGNALATYDYSKEDPIKLDEQVYTVNSADNIVSGNVLKVVSKITALNYFECRKIIENNGVICSGKAKDIIDILRELKSNRIFFTIQPNFKYDI